LFFRKFFLQFYLGGYVIDSYQKKVLSVSPFHDGKTALEYLSDAVSFVEVAQFVQGINIVQHFLIETMLDDHIKIIFDIPQFTGGDRIRD